MFYKIWRSKSPQYIFRLIPDKISSYVRRNADNIPLYNTKHYFYKNSFFPSKIIEWNNKSRWWDKYLSKRSLLKHTCSWRDKLIVLLDSNLCNWEDFVFFKNNIHKFIRLKPSSFFNCCNVTVLRGLDSA